MRMCGWHVAVSLNTDEKVIGNQKMPATLPLVRHLASARHSFRHVAMNLVSHRLPTTARSPEHYRRSTALNYFLILCPSDATIQRLSAQPVPLAQKAQIYRVGPVHISVSAIAQRMFQTFLVLSSALFRTLLSILSIF